MSIRRGRGLARPFDHQRGNRLVVRVGAQVDTANTERQLAPAGAAAALAHGEAGVGDLARNRLVAEQGEHDVGAALLGRAAAGAGLDRLAEMIDAEHQRAGELRELGTTVHDQLRQGGVVLVARSGIARGVRHGVDDDQRQRNAEVLLHPIGRLARESGEYLDGTRVEQPRAVIDPGEWQLAGSIGILGLEHRLQPRVNLARALDGEEQNAAVAGDRIVDEGEPDHDRGGEIEADESLVGAPLPADQADAGFRQQAVDQPGAQRRVLGVTMPAQSFCFGSLVSSVLPNFA